MAEKQEQELVIGFTGTRNGMTEAQSAAVARLLAEYKFCGKPCRAVHGDCIGADADFDALCERIGIERGCRPCTLTNMRANTGANELAAPKPPMQRNRDIVADATVMIACPPNTTRIKKGSGTWATIGCAEKASKPLTIVFPDGTVRHAHKHPLF